MATVALALVFTVSCHKLDIENPNGGKNPSFNTAKDAMGYVYTGQFARVSAMLTQQLRGSDIHYAPIYEQYVLPDNKMKAAYDIAYRHGVSVAVDKIEEYSQRASTTNDASFTKMADEARLVAASIYSVTIEYYSNPEKYISRDQSPTGLNYSDIYDLLDAVSTDDLKDEAMLLKARVKLNEKDYGAALSIINSVADKDQVAFGLEYAGSSTNMNEWQRFIGDRGKYLLADSNNIVKKYMVDDPRLATYYLSDEKFNFPLARNGSVNILGSIEAYFISAELKMRNDDKAGAEADYKKGIEASMKATGVTDFTNYMTEKGTLDNDKEKAIEQILTEKYLALFGHPMVFVDYKRTSYPIITHKASNFPNKWEYQYQ